MGVVRDITARKEAERHMALSDEILNDIGDVVLVADDRGAIVFASCAVERVLGWAPSQMLGDGWWAAARLTAEEQASAATPCPP